MRNEYKRVFDRAEMPQETEGKIMRKFDNAAPRRTVRPVAVIAAVAAATIVLGASAVAYTQFCGAGLFNDETKQLLSEPNFIATTVITSDKPIDEAPIVYPTDELIADEYSDEVITNGYVHIATDAEGHFPEVISNNGVMVILTDESGGGLQLKKGDTAQLSLSLNLDIAPTQYWSSDDIGERIYVGYICNGKPVRLAGEKVKDYTTELTADEDGEYYFYYINCSASYIIAEGAVNK